jgi:hypothetical protein
VRYHIYVCVIRRLKVKEVRVKSLINFVAIMMSINCMTQCRVRIFVKYCKRKEKK